MKEIVTRILKVIKKDFDEKGINENDDFILIPKSMLTEEQANYTEALNNFNVKNQLLIGSKKLVDEYIRKEKISLSCEKKRHIAMIKDMPVPQQLIAAMQQANQTEEHNQEEEEKDKVKKDYIAIFKENLTNEYINSEYTPKLKTLNTLQEKLYKEFEDAINENYKIDETKLNLDNVKELLKGIKYKNDKHKKERTIILD